MSDTTGYKKGWYKEWFGEDYLTVYKHRDDKDAHRLIELVLREISLPQAAYILDLACGNGRHSYILARNNFKVVGLDLSERLLNEALKRKQNHMFPLFIRGDMRFLPFRRQFDLIVSLFTSFGYFDENSKHEQVAWQIAESLCNGGWFVIDYFNAAYVKKHLVPTGKRIIDDIEIKEQRWISAGRVHKKIEIIKEDEIKEFFESVKMFEREELSAMLESAGIKTMKMYGDYSANPYSKKSKRMILIGKKE